jgi:hypothetical protein
MSCAFGMAYAIWEGMNNATLQGLRMTAADHAMGSAYDASRLTITKTAEGWEVRRGDKLLGVTSTREGAKELAGAL